MGWGNSFGGMLDPIWGEPENKGVQIAEWQSGKLDYNVKTNSKPTHDPYTNPNAHIYYECGCGAILDPHVKSFAALNNCASNSGWKIRFTDKGYVPYCVECGEGVE